MEVRLLESWGLPEGCLLSVRAGASRRQGPAEADRLKLNFARRLEYGEALRVDLLAPIGTADVRLKQGMDKYTVRVAPPFGHEIGVTIQVADAPPADVPPAPPPAQSEQERQKVLQAQAYLDKHDLLSWVQGLLQDVLREMPSNPWEYILEQRVWNKWLEAGGRRAAEPAATADRMSTAGSDPEAACDLPPDLLGCWAQAETDGRLAGLPVDLCKADESSRQAGPASTAEEVEQARLKALGALSGAVVDGRLGAALRARTPPTEVEEDADASAASAAAAIGGEVPLSPLDAGALASLRWEAQAALARAAATGQLHSALREVKEWRAGAQEVASSDGGLEALRRRAQEALRVAASSSDLQQAQKERERRWQAADAGHLEGLRRQAQAALANAVSDGSFLQAAAELRAQEAEPVGAGAAAREDGRQSPFETSGELDAVFAQARYRAKPGEASNIDGEDDVEGEEEDEEEQLRLGVRRMLLKASSCGHLDAALQGIGRTPKAAAGKVSFQDCDDELCSVQAVGVEEAKIQARRTILHASRSGLLASALQGSRGAQEPHIEADARAEADAPRQEEEEPPLQVAAPELPAEPHPPAPPPVRAVAFAPGPLGTAGLSELEARILVRNDFVRRENEALKMRNAQLRARLQGSTSASAPVLGMAEVRCSLAGPLPLLGRGRILGAEELRLPPTSKSRLPLSEDLRAGQSPAKVRLPVIEVGRWRAGS